MHTDVMLILITWCLLNDVFSMTKALNGQNSPKQSFHSGGPFSQKNFSWQMGEQTFTKKFMGVCST